MRARRGATRNPAAGVKRRNEHGLTPGQVRVLNAIVKHSTNAAAAQALGVSARTVENQLFHAYGALESRGLIRQRSRTALLAFWIKEGASL